MVDSYIFVEPYTGNRVSVTFFTHARFMEASVEQKQTLAGLGFRLPVVCSEITKPLGESPSAEETP